LFIGLFVGLFACLKQFFKIKQVDCQIKSIKQFISHQHHYIFTPLNLSAVIGHPLTNFFLNKMQKLTDNNKAN
jgi:hypothetical protein